MKKKNLKQLNLIANDMINSECYSEDKRVVFIPKTQYENWIKDLNTIFIEEAKIYNENHKK